MKLFLVVYIGPYGAVEYFSTATKQAALDKAAEWLEDYEDNEQVDVLRLTPHAPFTIERYDAIHDKWVS